VHFYVVWPPNAITEPNMLTTLVNKIEAINDFVSKNVTLKDRWDNFKNDVPSETVMKESNINIHSDDEKTEKEESKDIKELSKLLSGATDHFSMCLYLPNDFLFLGDLTKQETNCCLDYLIHNYYSNHVTLMIPPHHGTRWGENMYKIHSELTVVNNGKQRQELFDERLKIISHRVFSTFANGTIIADTAPNNRLVMPVQRAFPNIYFE
jgi:hypothetical protein